MASGVAGFAVFVGLMLVLAAVTSRLLGARFSAGRAVLTGWAGLAAGFGVGYLVTRRQPGITPVGRLDITQQAALRRLLVAVAQRDPTELYEAVTELAVTTGPGPEQRITGINAD